MNDQTILEEQEYINDELLNVTTYQAEWDIIDQPSGSRFEGRVINKEPYGYGSYYDDNGILRYCGTMVGWSRLGYGVSYYDTSHVEYDGMWVMNQFQGRGKKVIVYKYKRKTGYHKKNGHRQAYTQVKIDKINA